IGQFSSSEIAAMLHLEEAAVRQRLARARKQFQQLYQLESGEEIYEPVSGETAPRKVPASRESQPGSIERVESHEFHTQAHSSMSGRNHAERFYRNPAVTPLW
ncbi:MAG TPA: sigma factor-like helix-turn-helix DNA-binding protein, partial [Ktedonobacteraceae bacterium]|nr:sigma factor-like helix-turn-helix DNA-binding protein [Ktedonobacteraceae bacterium]